MNANHKITKYFVLYYSDQADELFQSFINKEEFRFDETSFTFLARLFKNISKVYIVIVNLEMKKVLAIVKIIEIKKGILKFEMKSKMEIYFHEIEAEKDFENKSLDFLYGDTAQIKYDLKDVDASIFCLSSKEEEDTFETIREIMKQNYKRKKKAGEQKETPQTKNNELINNPFLYSVLSYQQMCIAMQKK